MSSTAIADDLIAPLEAYSSAALNHLASFHSLAKKGPRAKPETVRLLAAALAEPRRIRATLAALSRGERAALEAVQRGGGKLSLRALRESLKLQGLLDHEPAAASAYGRPPDPQLKQPRRVEDIVARLCLRGLLFPADAVASRSSPYYSGAQAPLHDFTRPVVSVFIPASIRRHLPAPPPLVQAPAKLIKVEAVRESSARAFQRDLYLYWSFVQRQPLALTAKGEPRKAQLKEVNATLLVRAEIGKGETEIDHPRLRFVRLLLGALKLLDVHGDTVSASAAAADFFALPAAERVQKTFEAWRGGGFWNELVLLPPEVRPRAAAARRDWAADPPLLKARRLVLDHAAGLAPPDDWAAFDALISRIRGVDYEFLFSRRTGGAYYAPHPYTSYGNRFGFEFDNIASEEDGWDKVEANVIRAVVSGPFHWMGLVDLGWEGSAEKTPPEAFRLTALGRWVLNRGPQPEIPAEGGRVIVQPNMHIVALDPVVDATLLTLDRFAERLSAERAVEYRLTRASVYAGQQHGWDVARIRDFLQAQTGADLPGNVARTLEEWQAQHERIVLYPRVTLAHGRPEALDALAQHPQAAEWVAARLTPQLARLTSAGTLPAVVQALGERGTLAVVARPGVAAPNSVEAAASGELHLLARQPSLYLHGHLAAFADPVAGDRYTLSAATVTRATRAGLTAPQIIARLQAVHHGPLPAGLERRIRAWARHYGDAALETATLLQLRDPATLKELLADPELAALLQPFQPAAGKALARVRPQDVEKLRALLEARGIGLEDTLS